MSPDRDIRYYLDLVCAPIRRYGAGEPLVLSALLRLLRDEAVSAVEEDHREEIARQAALIVAGMSDELLADDRAGVLDLARRVEQVLDGELDAAFRDRAGETRSV